MRDRGRGLHTALDGRDWRRDPLLARSRHTLGLRRVWPQLLRVLPCRSDGGSCTPLETFATGGTVDSSPAVAGSQVYVGSGMASCTPSLPALISTATSGGVFPSLDGHCRRPDLFLARVRQRGGLRGVGRWLDVCLVAGSVLLQRLLAELDRLHRRGHRVFARGKQRRCLHILVRPVVRLQPGRRPPGTEPG